MANEAEAHFSQPHGNQPPGHRSPALETAVRQFLLHAPGLFLMLRGPAMIIDFASPALLSSWERDRSIIGQSLLHAIPELGDQPIFAVLQTVLTTGAPHCSNEEKVVILRNNVRTEAYYNYACQPVVESDGALWGLSMMAADVTAQVTARKIFQAALQEAESQKRLYETINANTPDLIYVFDLNYRFTYANAALLSMWGKSWEQAIGKTLLENGYQAWHAQMHEQEIDEAVATRRPIRGEVAFRHATLGRRIYDYIFVPVVDEHGNVQAIAGSTRDITDLREVDQQIRESEQRFRNLADDSPMFVFIIEPDPAATVSYWNKTWLEYTGQSLEQAKGNAWNGTIHPDDMSVVMDQYAPAFAARQAYFIPAVRVKRHDDAYRWHAFKGNPRYAADGTFNGYVGVGFDIHEQKLNEELIRQSEAALQQKVEERTLELRRSNDDLQQFAHVASHDLKEPVRKVRIYTDRVRNELAGPLPDKIPTYLDKIDNAARRMSAMIDGVLRYSSFTALDDAFEPVDLMGLVSDIESDLEILIHEKHARMKYAGLPIVHCSPVLLHQLLYNLINNSLKFSRPDIPARITISTGAAKPEAVIRAGLAPGNHYLAIIVRDNGIGFDQQDAGKIFQTFSRLHTKDEFEGTGLGLALCKKIAERHGGAIFADSEKGNGSEFTVLLPAR